MHHESGAMDSEVRAHLRAVECELEDTMSRIVEEGIETSGFRHQCPRVRKDMLWPGRMWALDRGQFTHIWTSTSPSENRPSTWTAR
jgi:hypothetical protein